MIRINQLKLNINPTEREMKQKILKTLRISEDQLIAYTTRKESIDARKKPELYYVYTVDVQVKKESALKKKLKNQKQIVFMDKERGYELPSHGESISRHRPVVIGMGPAGLFCAYLLAKEGYQPVLYERGACVEDRTADVKTFWETGILNTESNVQFGEGGAGTFSDGKLNTLVNDPAGRNMEVLRIFVENGASEKILYQNKPHIGTDVLMDVVKNMRLFIEDHGGEVHFHHKITNILYEGTEELKLTGLQVYDSESDMEFLVKCDVAVLAIGHSARDTFETLNNLPIPMEKKSFAIGVRVEHPQEMINDTQYGSGHSPDLPAAPYKLTCKTSNGRGVYTFCMCPGGYVVNASSEHQMLAVNGMSYSKRDGSNANSAVIVTVTPDDYPGDSVLSGMYFQRQLEKKAYEACCGKIPVQLYEDFCNHTISTDFGSILPQMRGAYGFGDVRSIFPEAVSASIEEGIRIFDQKIHGYARGDALLSGVESRTSSPVRILRDENLQSTLQGLYPCGEGAGYAGGITSAAMDGLKVAEKIISHFKPYTPKTNYAKI